MEMNKNINDDLSLIKMFIWNKKYVYLMEWKLELEWFFSVKMKYANSCLWIIGKSEDVLNVVGWVYKIINR